VAANDASSGVPHAATGGAAAGPAMYSVHDVAAVVQHAAHDAVEGLQHGAFGTGRLVGTPVVQDAQVAAHSGEEGIQGLGDCAHIATAALRAGGAAVAGAAAPHLGEVT